MNIRTNILVFLWVSLLNHKKNSLRSDIDQKGHGRGTCTLYYYDRELKFKILGELQAVCSVPERTNVIIKDVAGP